MPNFASACGANETEQLIHIDASLNEDGFPRTISAYGPATLCAKQIAIEAVRQWIYEPPIFKDRLRDYFGIAFDFFAPSDESVEIFWHSEGDIRRRPPRYPDRCQHKTSGVEVVIIKFDLTPEGKTENISVLESTNDCFEKSAIASVRRWRYSPHEIGDQNVRLDGIITSITFELDVSTEVRRLIAKSLTRVSHSLNHRDDPQYVLDELAQLQFRVDGDFLDRESAVFHRYRGSALLALSQKDEALNEFKRAISFESDPSMVAELELVVREIEAGLGDNSNAAIEN